MQPLENESILYLVDSCTTLTILKDRKFFQTIIEKTMSVTTIANNNVLIMGSEGASLILSMGRKLII